MSSPAPAWLRYRFEPTGADVHEYPHCNGGPCRQGRAICPSPQECMVPEREPEPARPTVLSRFAEWLRRKT